jgi:putative endonuclease
MGLTANDGRLATGRRAEAIAAEHLTRLGMRIVCRNWRRPEGEIDLVAEDAGTWVFVEVRSRTGFDSGHPFETVDRRKRARIVRSALLYLNEETPPARDFRFDVVGVVFAGRDGDGQPQCDHLRDAFRIGDP